MKESWWTMADLTELNFFSRQDFFDLTKEMSSCAAQLLKKYFKSKRSSLEISRLNGVALASAQASCCRLIPDAPICISTTVVRVVPRSEVPGYASYGVDYPLSG